MRLRFTAVLVWSFLVTIACGYMTQYTTAVGRGVLFTADFALIIAAIFWYSRRLPVRPQEPAEDPVRRWHLAEAERKAELERRTGKSLEDWRNEAANWFPDKPVLDYMAEYYAALSETIREIVDSELKSTNSILDVTGSVRDNRVAHVCVEMRDDFRCDHPALVRQERWGWEHCYIDPVTGHEVRAIFRRSTAEQPVLCRHLNGLESALHRAGIGLVKQVAYSQQRWLRFNCDLDTEAAMRRYSLGHTVAAQQYEIGDDRTGFRYEGQLYCNECRCGIHGTGESPFPTT